VANDPERIEHLEGVIAQFLRPVRGIPFNIIVRALSGRQLLRFERRQPDDAALLTSLKRAIKVCARDLRDRPIRRPRPNEVGNDVESYVLAALNAGGLQAERPRSAGGKSKAAGYPDLLILDGANRPSYLECKIFGYGKPDSTFRSFYLSPSDTFKVSRDARHLLLAFGMEAKAIEGSRDSIYMPRSFKLIDLHDLLCDVKYEFNSDNRRLYSPAMVIAQGEI
jgi:hypothetical protein